MRVIKAEYHSPGEKGRRGFEDLECYKLALDIVANIHVLARHLPPEEKYDLAAQIRRSSKGITGNIAEGYGRYHYLDSLRFYSIARGEVNETLSRVIEARVLNYVEQAYFDEVYALIRRAESTLNGYMTYVRKQKSGAQEYGERAVREDSVFYMVDEFEEEGGRQLDS
jgi:four helix bundle protein